MVRRQDKPTEFRKLLLPPTTSKTPRIPMAAQFMTVKHTAEYLNMSITWVYRDAPKLGLVPYKFGAGHNAKLQFKTTEVRSWADQQRLC